MAMDPSEFERREQAIYDRIIDRVASDPNFAQQLKANPEQAIQAAGLQADVEALAAAQESQSETAGYRVGVTPFNVSLYRVWGRCVVKKK
jgi:hypothetical protein